MIIGMVNFLLGSDVDNLSIFFIKTSNAKENIESDIQNIKPPRTNGPIILYELEKHTYMVSLKEFLKLFKCLASSGIYSVSGWLNLLFKALYQERKRRKERILTRLA